MSSYVAVIFGAGEPFPNRDNFAISDEKSF